MILYVNLRFEQICRSHNQEVCIVLWFGNTSLVGVVMDRDPNASSQFVRALNYI
jgi:hypothetical protein